ncbi:MAG: PEP-CTERM sorting domain-containing protein [Verrucomicrobium sp.]|nr:PEP-CTERM sorting domain-containing protein [Verrucomicrobium sp.]
MKKAFTLALCAALLGVASAPRAEATFTAVTNAFSGTNPGGTSLTASSLLLFGDTTNGVIGPNWNATVTLSAGAVYSETLTINSSSNPGSFILAGGGVLAIGNSFSATKTFTGNSFDASSTYALTITAASAAAVSLFSNLSFTLTQGGVTLADTSTGVGILGGALNLLNLFGGTATGTFQFTTPTTLNTTSPFVLTLTGSTAAGLLGNSTSFTSLSINSVSAVPEPRTSAMLGAGLLWALLRGRSLVRKYRGLDSAS